MVCYDNVTVTELPTIDEFIAECGFCRTCFTAVPEFSECQVAVNTSSHAWFLVPILDAVEI